LKYYLLLKTLYFAGRSIIHVLRFRLKAVSILLFFSRLLISTKFFAQSLSFATCYLRSEKSVFCQLPMSFTLIRVQFSEMKIPKKYLKNIKKGKTHASLI